MATATIDGTPAKVVSAAEWLTARKNFLRKEKEFTRLRDELSRQRRELPWEKVEKQYAFEGPHGKETLADLFAGRGQLILYHFMFGPGWREGCPSCSYLSDSFDAAAIHLAHRDTTLAVISRATWPEIQAFQKRMGWQFHWVSSNGTAFNYDFQVSQSAEEKSSGLAYYNYEQTTFPSEERPGMSIFSRRGDEIFHTYSTYGRGNEYIPSLYTMLDLTALGRQEAWEEPKGRAPDLHDT
jgi:predicted dithiol-disulfide oxidoreductase (DUF899 family)